MNTLQRAGICNASWDRMLPHRSGSARGLLALTLWILSVRLAYAQQSPEYERVFIGPEFTDAVSLPTTELVAPYDIAYDAPSKTLLIMGRRHVHQWSEDGKLLREWRLPEGLDPGTVLFADDGVFRLVMAEWPKQSSPAFAFPLGLQSPKRFVQVSLLADDAAGVHVDEKQWTREDDTALNPGIAQTIRGVMHQVSYISEDIPCGVGVPQSHPELVPIHAQAIGHDLVAWSSDLSTVFFCWSGPAYTTLASRSPDGSYSVTHCDDLLRGLTTPRLDRNAPVRFDAVTCYQDVMLLGTSVYTEGKHEYSVLWLDLKDGQPKLVKKSPGRLARRLQHYGTDVSID